MMQQGESSRQQVEPRATRHRAPVNRGKQCRHHSADGNCNRAANALSLFVWRSDVGPPIAHRRLVVATTMMIMALGAGIASAQVRTQTFSTSTTVRNDAGPSCVPSSVLTVTLEETTGPACIGIGNRDIANPAPACAGNPPAIGPGSPSRGDTFIVATGSINLNTNRHTDIVNCTAPRVIPTIDGTLLGVMASVLALLGIDKLRRRRAVGNASR